MNKKNAESSRINAPDPLEIDHILIACASLEDGHAFSQELFGCTPGMGGAHPGQGTHNAILVLEDGIYIEFIAPDRSQDGHFPLAECLQTFKQPALAWWSVRLKNADSMARSLMQSRAKLLARLPGSRRSPDGGLLSWEVLLADAPELGALLPFYICWEDMRHHPSGKAEAQGRLIDAEISHTGSSIADLLPDSVREYAESETAALSLRLEFSGRQVALQAVGNQLSGVGKLLLGDT